MVNLKKKSYVKNIRSIPKISFDKTEDWIYFDALVADWLGLEKSIEEIMGLILIRLGFRDDDNIKLCNYDKEENLFQCIVNGDGFYSIKFKDINSNNGYAKIVLDRFDNEFEYECIPLEVSELGIRISLASYNVKYPNGMIFTRDLSEKYAKFKIELDDYVLELELDRSIDVGLRLFDEKGRYWKYRLNNENELIQYLTSLTFPVSIEELYKRICEISLGDVSKYPELLLKLYRVQDVDKKKLKVTGLVHLRNGELEVFGITRNNKLYFLNSDDSWSCEKLVVDPFVDFSMNVIGDEINYNISFKNGNFDANRELVESDIRIAQHEIEYVRKRAKMLVFNKDVNNDSD